MTPYEIRGKDTGLPIYERVLWSGAAGEEGGRGDTRNRPPATPRTAIRNRMWLRRSCPAGSVDSDGDSDACRGGVVRHRRSKHTSTKRQYTNPWTLVASTTHHPPLSACAQAAPSRTVPSVKLGVARPCATVETVFVRRTKGVRSLPSRAGPRTPARAIASSCRRCRL